MTAQELADQLLDAIDDARRIPKRRIVNGDLAGFRNDLIGWKESARRLIRTELGRADASRFDEVADVEILGPTWAYLEDVIARYDEFLTELSERVRNSGPVPEARPVTSVGSDRVLEAFCSYSSKDETFRRQLETHLAPLLRDRLLELWSFRKLEPGAEWDAEIRKHLTASELVLVLVSPDFLASSYSWTKELEYALTRHEQGAIRVVPIIVRECDWQSTRLGQLQALPTGGKAINTWRNRDEAWLDVVIGIRKVMQSVRAASRPIQPTVLTPGQREILDAFAHRDIRAGEGFPINVLIGMRNLGPELDALAEMGAITVGPNHFILLTPLGEHIAYETET